MATVTAPTAQETTQIREAVMTYAHSALHLSQYYVTCDVPFPQKAEVWRDSVKHLGWACRQAGLKELAAELQRMAEVEG